MITFKVIANSSSDIPSIAAPVQISKIAQSLTYAIEATAYNLYCKYILLALASFG